MKDYNGKPLISEEAIRKQLGDFFPNALLLNIQFDPLSLGEHVEKVTGYTLHELQSQSLNVLSKTVNFKQFLKEKLQSGSFEQEPFPIQTKAGKQISCKLSGFYLGLISSINDVIVVQFGCVEELCHLQKQLEAKTVELDSFVHLASHRLRGPLATVKGLVNLARMTKDPADMDFIFNQMDRFADLLDSDLYKLIHFAEPDKIGEYANAPKSLAEVTEELLWFYGQEFLGKGVRMEAPEPITEQTKLKNSGLVLELLKNLATLFAEMPQKGTPLLQLRLAERPSSAEIWFRADGIANVFFEKQDIDQFGFADMLNSSQFSRYYDIKNIVDYLKGEIIFSQISPNEIVVHIIFPI